MISFAATSVPPLPTSFWVADITYLRSWEGWIYLAAVQNAFSRRVVGWALNPEPPTATWMLCPY